jgi:hypothetical protein
VKKHFLFPIPKPRADEFFFFFSRMKKNQIRYGWINRKNWPEKFWVEKDADEIIEKSGDHGEKLFTQHVELLDAKTEIFDFDSEEMSEKVLPGMFYRKSLTFRQSFIFKNNPLILEMFPLSIIENEQGLLIVETQIYQHLIPEKEQRKIQVQKHIAAAVFQHLFETFSFHEPDAFLINPGEKERIKLTPGDHLERSHVFSEHSPFHHHAIYVGRGYVVEVDGDLNVHQLASLLTLQKTQHFFASESPMIGAQFFARLVTLDDFVSKAKAKSRIRIVDESQPFAGPIIRTRKEIILLSLQMLGVWNYNIWHANCEVFANFVTRDRSITDQALELLKYSPAFFQSESPDTCKFGSVEAVEITATLERPDGKMHLVLWVPDPWTGQFYNLSEPLEDFQFVLEHQKTQKIPFHYPLTGAKISPQLAQEIMEMK